MGGGFILLPWLNQHSHWYGGTMVNTLKSISIASKYYKDPVVRLNQGFIWTQRPWYIVFGTWHCLGFIWPLRGLAETGEEGTSTYPSIHPQICFAMRFQVSTLGNKTLPRQHTQNNNRTGQVTSCLGEETLQLCLCIVLGQVTGSITDHLEGHFIVWWMYRPKLSLTVFGCCTSSQKKYMPFYLMWVELIPRQF